MGSVVAFPDQRDLDKVTYIENEGDLGVCLRNRKIQVLCLNKNEFEIITPDGSQLHDRESLAELLWVTAVFVDPEEKWKPDMNLVGRDY